MNEKRYERKDFPALVISTDDEKGIVEAIVSVIGNVDLGDDIIHPGSFTKTLQERFGKIKVLDNHNSFSTLNAIGKPLEMREMSKGELPKELTDKYPLATGGLYTKTQYAIDTPEGLGVFKRIKSGIITEYSIGFSIPKGKWDITEQVLNSIKTKIRNIREIILYEYSPVLWGMNDATMTVGVKSEHKDLSLFDIEMEVMKSFNDLHLMSIGEVDEYGYQEKEGYRCGSVYPDYLLARPYKVDAEFEYYKVNYSHTDDYSSITFANQEDWQGGNFQFVIGAKSASELLVSEGEIKAGKVISSANMSKLTAAVEALQAIISAASADALDNSANNITNDNKSNDNEVDTVISDNPITLDANDLELMRLKHLAFIDIIKTRKN